MPVIVCDPQPKILRFTDLPVLTVFKFLEGCCGTIMGMVIHNNQWVVMCDTNTPSRVGSVQCSGSWCRVEVVAAIKATP